MENKKDKKTATIAWIDTMIQNADKGPSGFWTEDYEGCGNPDIFPEFDEGLKHGKLVQKEHYLCPWNTAILYGNKRGNIRTGCYHSCSIEDARHLKKDMLVNVLCRFKKRMMNGSLDNLDIITPLLDKSEINYIEKQKNRVCIANKQAQMQEVESIRALASKLIANHPEYEDTIVSNYGKKIVSITNRGYIDFDPDGLKDVVNGEKLTYNDYIDAQINAIIGDTHDSFQWCFYNIPFGFKGQVEKINDKYICFQRVYVEGMYSDGLHAVDSEQHVWMDREPFEGVHPGDCVQFSAEAYRYLKTGKGKQIDFGLRNPSGVIKIEKYDFTSKEEIRNQELDFMLCDVCPLSENCNHIVCMYSKWKRETKESMNDVLKE